MAVTYDSWTSISHHSYIAVTGHFIQDCQLKKALLSFTEESGSHTSEVIAEIIGSTVRNLKENLEISCCVTDNARNMTKSAENLKTEHLGCFIHTIQLVIRDALIDCSPKKVKDKVAKDKNEFDSFEK